MDLKNEGGVEAISQKQIDECIHVLESLVSDTNQIFDIPKEKRTALIKAAGLFSRPNRDEFSRRKKDAKKNEKRKKAARDKHARKVTGIRSAREAHVFVAPKLPILILQTATASFLVNDGSKPNCTPSLQFHESISHVLFGFAKFSVSKSSTSSLCNAITFKLWNVNIAF